MIVSPALYVVEAGGDVIVAVGGRFVVTVSVASLLVAAGGKAFETIARKVDPLSVI